MRSINVVAATFILVFFSMLSRGEVLADDCRRILIYESPSPGQSPPAIFDDCHNPAPGLKAEPPIPIPRLVEPKPSADLPKPFPYPDPSWRPTPSPPPPPPEPAIAEPPTPYSKSPQTVQSIPYSEAVERVKSVGVIDAYLPQQQKEIVEEKGTSVYEVQGTKQEKVLGIIPITIAKIVIVSTSDGNIVSVRTSFLQKLLDFISF